MPPTLMQNPNKVFVPSLIFFSFSSTFNATGNSSFDVQAMLASEEADALRENGYSFPEDVSPSTFISLGIDLQDQQYAHSPFCPR